MEDGGHNLKILSTRTPKLCLLCRLSTPSHESRFAALRQRSCGNGSLRYVQRFLRMYARIFILSLFNFFFALPSDRRFLIWTTSDHSLGYKSCSLSYQQFCFIFEKKNGNTPASWANNSCDLTTFIHSFQIIPQTFRALNRSRNIKNTRRDFAYVSVGLSLYFFHVIMTALSLSLNWIFWRAIVSL